MLILFSCGEPAVDLGVNDQVIENPSAQDIVRAIDATPYPED
jgi:hypothetical protein